MNQFEGFELEDAERMEKAVTKVMDAMNDCGFTNPLDMVFVLNAVQQAVVISLYDHVTFNEENADDYQASEQEQGETVQEQTEESKRLRGYFGD